MAIDPSGADLQRFGEGDAGEAFVMVQLLRFAEGGRERYLQYSAKAYPFLTRVGAQVLYGGECNDLGRLALHAAELGFRHSATNKHLHWSMPLPDDLRQFIDREK